MIASEAYAVCERLARTHYENFPVASLLLPRQMRPHIAAIYAFARVADDFADEGTVDAAARLRRLDEWLMRLRASVAPGELREETQLSMPSGDNSAAHNANAIFTALAQTIHEHELPVSLFEDLLSAFRQDVTKTRYETWPDLLDYCRRSANPVGRLVLRVAGHADEDLDRASDAVCTALQLTNFWQDVERDWMKGRLYVPLADLRSAGVATEHVDLRGITPEWRQVLQTMAGRTRILFEKGRGVCDGVSGRLRFELRLTWLGGRRILDTLERRGFDVFARRPALGKADIPALAWRALTWRAAPAGQ